MCTDRYFRIVSRCSINSGAVNARIHLACQQKKCFLFPAEPGSRSSQFPAAVWLLYPSPNSARPCLSGTPELDQNTGFYAAFTFFGKSIHTGSHILRICSLVVIAIFPLFSINRMRVGAPCRLKLPRQTTSFTVGHVGAVNPLFHYS